ncbi:hypothetical protein OH77DRAFT_1438565 [Trametes cingulata]|nr:hypothetical protein OH77DRAFT_1438565 [Trametes cingulata]
MQLQCATTSNARSAIGSNASPGTDTTRFAAHDRINIDVKKAANTPKASTEAPHERTEHSTALQEFVHRSAPESELVHAPQPWPNWAFQNVLSEARTCAVQDPSPGATREPRSAEVRPSGYWALSDMQTNRRDDGNQAQRRAHDSRADENNSPSNQAAPPRSPSHQPLASRLRTWMTCPARKLRQVTFCCCGAKSCIASTYSCVSLPSSSEPEPEPESIVLHADEDDAERPAEDVEAIVWCAEVAERCVEAVEGAREVVDINEEAEATDGLRSRREELAVLLEVDGVRGSLREGARLDEGSARATEVSILRWETGMLAYSLQQMMGVGEEGRAAPAKRSTRRKTRKSERASASSGAREPVSGSGSSSLLNAARDPTETVRAESADNRLLEAPPVHALLVHYRPA